MIVEASFKLFPAPLYEETVGRPAARFEEAWAEAERALALRMPPVALELVHEEGGFNLAGRIAGSEDGVRRILGELGWAKAPAGFWQEHARRTSGRWARLSVRRGSLASLLRSLPAAARWIAQPGVGVAHWFDFESAAEVLTARRAAEAAGGSLVLLAAPPELKREVGAWGTPPPTVELMRRLRSAFDPRQTLSPGRYLV